MESLHEAFYIYLYIIITIIVFILFTVFFFFSLLATISCLLNKKTARPKEQGHRGRKFYGRNNIYRFYCIGRGVRTVKHLLFVGLCKLFFDVYFIADLILILLRFHSTVSQLMNVMHLIIFYSFSHSFSFYLCRF